MKKSDAPTITSTAAHILPITFEVADKARRRARVVVSDLMAVTSGVEVLN